MTDIAIRASKLGKCYQIYDKPAHRLRQFVLPPLDRLLGRAERVFYRDFWAVRDISFQVRRGETVGVIGRNGSGKSTLLQIVCGTLAPSHGEVQTHGRVAALLELGSGFNPEFSGRENVYMNAAILGLSPEEIDDRFEAIVDFSEIGAFLDQPVKTYSSGMMVRLAFSTAIHVSPDLLVVDEALSVGDTAFQAKCLARIRDMQANGVSILLVSHSNNVIMEYCDRALFLKQGALIMDGPCRETVAMYAESIVDEERAKLSSTTHRQVAIDTDTSSTKATLLAVRILDDSGQQRALFSFGESFTIEVRARFEDADKPPAIGLQIKSSDGIALWSANTHKLGIGMAPVIAGCERAFRWRLRANFSGNRYVFAVGVGYVVNNEYRRFARRDYAGHIDVMPLQNGGIGWLAPMPEFMSIE